MPQDIPTTCDGCSKKFSIDHALSCPKGGLVLERHDDTTKEWGALGARALVPSAITYKPKINSRTVQGERTGAGARQEGGESEGSTDRLVGQPGHVVVPAELRADVSAHGFWKRGTLTSALDSAGTTTCPGCPTYLDDPLTVRPTVSVLPSASPPSCRAPAPVLSSCTVLLLILGS